MKTAVIFDNFGPYHLARLRAAGKVSDLLAVEVVASSGEYEWERRTENRGRKGDNGTNWRTVTLLEGGTSREVSNRELEVRLNQVLSDFQAQAVFIPGWSSRAAFAALRWCVYHKVPAVVMSESTEWDEGRSGWREAVKRRIVGICSAALVGGTPHKDYMVRLGMPAERIFLGYDAVDNRYFADKVAGMGHRKSEIRNQYGLPDNYFLASARFVKKKNLPRLIEAYSHYRTLVENDETLIRETPKLRPGKSTGHNAQPLTAPWSLVLLGDGALRETLNSQLSTLNLRTHVQMPGFKQYPDLPAYYGLAKAFIHASTTEQWGLVVNEAMASGLPVLVSNRCGCATDLVKEGANGFTLDPLDAGQLAHAMLRLWKMEDGELYRLGAAGARIIVEWGPERFAQGLKAAADKAVEAGPVKVSLAQRGLLRALMMK